MKKLNRKGFTLIELLAVIVVLAIILVVTIPSVLSTMSDARYKAFKNAADSTAEWFTKQYELNVLGASLGSGTVDQAYTTFVGSSDITAGKTLDATVLEAAGISGAGNNVDVANSKVTLNGTKFCVELTAKDGGSFYNNSDATKNKVTSSGCPSTSTP